jgi:hypothetical protein
MTKQAGGVHDLTTKRAAGLQKINELFPNQFREDPRFGGLMTPEERPGPGPRGPAGRVGGGKSPPLVKPPGPLKQITSMFQDMASGYPKAARNLSVAASKAPLVSYPLAGFNIGSEGMAVARDLSSENPDYLEAALSGMGALGTGLSMYPPTAPFGIPIAAVPPIVRYFRDRPPEEDPSLGLECLKFSPDLKVFLLSCHREFPPPPFEGVFLWSTQFVTRGTTDIHCYINEGACNLHRRSGDHRSMIVGLALIDPKDDLVTG